MSYEAFVYQWYDSKNRMFYLGKHKGTPDDGYTHSSTIMESFKSDEVPPYMKRRILAYGTHEEMCELEYKLLLDRKAKCWDRYYNRGLGDPRVIDQSGEKNPMYGKSHSPETKKKISEFAKGRTGEKNPSYKHGLSGTREYQREHERKYRAENAEKISEHKRKYYEKNRKEIREHKRKYYEKNRKEILERKRKYRAENREKIREQNRKYRVENPEKIREQNRKYYEKKKLEKEQANSTSLDGFMS